MMLKQVLAFLLVVFVAGQVFSSACPKLCRCLVFEGRNSVYCNRTDIRAIPDDIPVNTELLDVSWNSIVNVSRDDLSMLTNLQAINLAANNFDKNCFTPDALELPNLVSVDLSYNLFSRVPDFLPVGLVNLSLFTNLFTHLRGNSFHKFAALQNLDVSNNNISIIDPDTFVSMRNLQKIDLSYNHLADDSFPPNVFARNSELRYLSLRFNLVRRLLPDLPDSLEHLDYVGNDIKILPKDSFVSMPNLTSLWFWKCKISIIEDGAFSGLSRLTFLDLMENKVFSIITDKTFNDLSALETLYLGMNNITQINPGAFKSLLSLKTIWLTGNEISTLAPEVLNTSYVPNLVDVYLEFNPWFCDCHLRWLRESLDTATYVVHNPSLLKCSGPSRVKGKSFNNLKPSDFVCN